jgi:uncharacterized protein with von Willebrand factor type A (vWA) domain
LTGRFDPRALEARFAALDAMPRALWMPAIVNTEGPPVARLEAVAAARRRLLEGRPPFVADDGWPASDVAAAFGLELARLDAPALALGSEDVAAQLLRLLLWHVDRIARLCGAMPRPEAVRACAQAFAADWEETGEELREVLRVVESLDGVANFARWTEVRGLLKSQAWQEVLAAHRRVAGMPKLAALLRRLGRAEPFEEETEVEVALAASDASAPQWVRRVREVELPGVPLETEGIRRSGDFHRMLPGEALLWRRRRRMLAARLAEQTLLSYQHRHVMPEATWSREPGAAMERRRVRRPVLQQGPVILCVDTSASMAGAPEQVAKAVVLEAMRAAAAGRRDCLVYAFSGPGDLLEMALSRDLDGLLAAAAFLGRSFHGGTDVCEPFERALGAIETARWRRADLLLATDGEFGAAAGIVERLGRARRELGLRVQGVLIGDRETIGLAEVCDEVFWVSDWRRYGRHGQVEPPVHASDLTARFFPGAFVGRGGVRGAGAPRAEGPS